MIVSIQIASIVLLVLFFFGFILWIARNGIDINELNETIPEDIQSEIVENDIGICQKYKSKGEEICCKSLSKMFNKPFLTIRPNWLKNPDTGRSLEIDCFNDELSLGIEYNGEQHYVYPNRFHKTEEEFLKQVERDRTKKFLCDINGVKLITVPYTIKHEDIPKFLEEKISKLN